MVSYGSAKIFVAKDVFIKDSDLRGFVIRRQEETQMISSLTPFLVQREISDVLVVLGSNIPRGGKGKHPL